MSNNSLTIGGDYGYTRMAYIAESTIAGRTYGETLADKRPVEAIRS